MTVKITLPLDSDSDNSNPGEIVFGILKHTEAVLIELNNRELTIKKSDWEVLTKFFSGN